MANVYLDNDVTRYLKPELEARGHTTVLTREVPGMATASDGHQLMFAARSGAVIVTHNKKDFELLHDAWRRWSVEWNVVREHAGILIVPQTLNFVVLAEALAKQLPATQPNELYEMYPNGHWEHYRFRP